MSGWHARAGQPLPRAPTAWAGLDGCMHACMHASVVCRPTACSLLPPLPCSSQFRLVGLLVSPRSRRLQNAVHACLPGQAARLHRMMQVRWAAAARAAPCSACTAEGASLTPNLPGCRRGLRRKLRRRLPLRPRPRAPLHLPPPPRRAPWTCWRRCGRSAPRAWAAVGAWMRRSMGWRWSRGAATTRMRAARAQRARRARRGRRAAPLACG